MADFTPINTQEEFDSAIGERLKRERAKYDGYMSPDEVAKKYEGWMSPEEAKKYDDYLSPEQVNQKYKGWASPEEVAAKDKQIKDYEISALKSRVAREMDIPAELADRLSGETEADIRKDAKIFAGAVGVHKGAPARSAEPSDAGNDKRAAYRELLNKIQRGE